MIKKLELLRCEKGVLLSEQKRHSIQSHTALENLLNLPFSFYLLDRTGKTKMINQEGVNVCGYTSIEESIGKSLLDISKIENAQKLICNCQEVIETSTIKIYEEEHIRNDGMQLQFLSVKSPLYDQNNQIMGVCGFSIVLGRHALAQSLAIIADLGLLNTQTNSFPIAPTWHAQFTQREQDCLRYVVRGYTAKHIAKMLGISYRTVQEYIHNMRMKVGADSKGQLIEMAMR